MTLPQATTADIGDRARAYLPPPINTSIITFASSVIPYILDNPRYRDAAIAQHMTEPDRTIVSRVV